MESQPRRQAARLAVPEREGVGTMGAATVEFLTPDQAQARRDELIASVGGDESVFRERAAQYALDEHESAVLDEVELLDYLLSGDVRG